LIRHGVVLISIPMQSHLSLLPTNIAQHSVDLWTLLYCIACFTALPSCKPNSPSTRCCRRIHLAHVLMWLGMEESFGWWEEVEDSASILTSMQVVLVRATR
jgi:hypothetical protein